MQQTSAPATGNHAVAVIGLVMVALVWGATFVMVKDALASVGPLTFVGVRFTLAAVLLAAFFPGRMRGLTRAEVFAGGLTGSALAAGYAFQTIGLQFTSSSKAGFITGLNVVMVPVLTYLLLRQPPRRAALLGVGVAAVGLGLLSLDASLRIQPGDLWIMACAVGFALQIVGVAHFAPQADVVRLAVVQLAVTAVLNLGGAALLEPLTLQLPGNTWFAIVFTALLATAAAFSMQVYAQRIVSPSQTALIFTLEPVAAALFGWLLAAEVLTPQQWLGCTLILLGMLASEIHPAWFTRTKGQHPPDP